MGYCRAFFGDLNDWLHRDHHFSFEPSGISKRKVLFQVINIFQVAEHVYLPVGDEPCNFIVQSRDGVHSASELLDFFKEILSKIERMREVPIENVLLTLKKPKEIPFYYTLPLPTPTKRSKPKVESDVDSSALDDIFKQGGPVDISVVLVTESNGDEETELATDGSQATSLLLFVHSKNQPESEETKSLNQQTSLRSTEGETGPSDPKNVSLSSPIKVFKKAANPYGWVAKRAPSLSKCLRGVTCIFLQDSKTEEFKARLGDWQLMLAHLLRQSDEEIEKNKTRYQSLMTTEYRRKTIRDHWKRVKGSFKSYFERNSGAPNPERPIFLCASFKATSRVLDRSMKKVICNLDEVGGILLPPRSESNSQLVCPYCPDVVTFKDAILKQTHLLDVHQKTVYKSLQCPICGQKGFKNENTTRVHIYRHTKEKGQKRKPEETASPVCATPGPKRTSQVKSVSSPHLSCPSVSSPETQATTFHIASVPYSGHLKPAQGCQEENSKITWPMSPTLPNLSTVFCDDVFARLH